MKTFKIKPRKWKKRLKKFLIEGLNKKEAKEQWAQFWFEHKQIYLYSKENADKIK